MKNELFDTNRLRFNGDGLIPAVIQDWRTEKVLTLLTLDRKAVDKTVATGEALFDCRSVKGTVITGRTGGTLHTIRAIHTACDGAALLLMVERGDKGCHSDDRSCFSEKPVWTSPPAPGKASILDELYGILIARKDASPDSSYVASLYAKGTEGIIEKVREESEEFIEASRSETEREIVNELADTVFHAMVMLAYKDIPVNGLFTELTKRFGTSGIEEKRSRQKKEERE